MKSIATQLGSVSAAQRAPALLVLQRTHGNQYVQRVVAGELHLKYDLPTADSLIAATSLIENVGHIVTDDSHFITTKNLIKPIDLKKALKLVSK